MSKEKLTPEEIRLNFYGKDDSRSYDQDEIDLMKQYAEQYHIVEGNKKETKPLCNCDEAMHTLNELDFNVCATCQKPIS